jgi:hypothetical protein
VPNLTCLQSYQNVHFIWSVKYKWQFASLTITPFRYTLIFQMPYYKLGSSISVEINNEIWWVLSTLISWDHPFKLYWPDTKCQVCLVATFDTSQHHNNHRTTTLYLIVQYLSACHYSSPVFPLLGEAGNSRSFQGFFKVKMLNFQVKIRHEWGIFILISFSLKYDQHNFFSGLQQNISNSRFSLFV